MLALALIGCPTAEAQDSLSSANAAGPAATSSTSAPAADEAQASAALKTLSQSFSGPEPPPSLPATPHRLALMRQYMQVANVAASMKLFSALGYDQTKGQIQAFINAMPASRRAVVLAAFEKAYQAADARRQQKLMDAMADYFATRMTDEELATVVDYASSGLASKMLHGAVLTPEEREQNGRYIIEHPPLLKFTKLEFYYIRSAQGARDAVTAAFQADFRANLCRNLAEAHLKSSNCSAPHA